MKKKIELFETFIMRAPLYPISDFFVRFSKSKVGPDELIKICSKKEFLEAIYLSSPSLYHELKKLISNNIKTEKEKERLYISIFKYYSRMSCRSTPFGIFATVGVGKLGDSNKFFVSPFEEVSKVTRLDMDCINALSTNLATIPEIKTNLLYRANDSIYHIGHKLRCVEHKNVRGKRVHHIFETQRSSILNNVISASAVADGLSLAQLKDHLLITEDLEEEYESVIYNFLNELIDAQLLISELSPTTIGNGALNNLIKKMSLRVPKSRELNILISIQNKLEILNSKSLGDGLKHYNPIIEDVREINSEINEKIVFQTDAKRTGNDLTLDQEMKNDVITTIQFLKKWNMPNRNNNLENFKREYLRRYGSDDIKLTVALDNEIGIGYGRHVEESSVSPLVDDLRLPISPVERESTTLIWTSIDELLFEKYTNAIRNKLYEIEITDEDIKDTKLGLSDQDFPPTFSAFLQLFEEGGSKKILFKHAGGSSAINLIARFCHVDKQIHKHAQEIADYEDQFYESKLVSEINHLPESRVGNVLYRPQLRKYEIGYLAQSDSEYSVNIEISDIYLSVRNNKIELFSKKNNKEIIPRLSTAHNYTYNSLPIYRFLCDLQSQNLVKGVRFNWGALSKLYKFKPRVSYKNVILSGASWTVDVKKLLSEISQINDNELLHSVNDWRVENKMPQWVSLKRGDNELVINLSNLLCIKTLLSMIKNKNEIELIEVFMTSSPTKGEKGKVYSNEFILSLKNKRNTSKDL